jgi:hypothetical protein
VVDDRTNESMDGKTAKMVFALFEEIRGFLSVESNLQNFELFRDFALRVYPKIHAVYYSHSILDKGDKAFVVAEGAAGLMALPLKGEDKPEIGGDHYSGGAQKDARIIYLIVDDLNSYFHQQDNFQTEHDIQTFARPMRDRLNQACDSIRPRLLLERPDKRQRY